jgi:hypothetical protein
MHVYMKKLAAMAFVGLLSMGLFGCAANNGQIYSNGNRTSSNLDAAARANHNSLLPASFYDSNLDE